VEGKRRKRKRKKMEKAGDHLFFFPFLLFDLKFIGAVASTSKLPRQANEKEMKKRRQTHKDTDTGTQNTNINEKRNTYLCHSGRSAVNPTSQLQEVHKHPGSPGQIEVVTLKEDVERRVWGHVSWNNISGQKAFSPCEHEGFGKCPQAASLGSPIRTLSGDAVKRNSSSGVGEATIEAGAIRVDPLQAASVRAVVIASAAEATPRVLWAEPLMAIGGFLQKQSAGNTQLVKGVPDLNQLCGEFDRIAVSQLQCRSTLGDVVVGLRGSYVVIVFVISAVIVIAVPTLSRKLPNEFLLITVWRGW